MIWEAKSQDETDACRLRFERGTKREKEGGRERASKLLFEFDQ